MTTLNQLKRELRTVNRALFGDDDKDEYGRSKARLRQSAEYHRQAYQNLTPEEQHIVDQALVNYAKYERKIQVWEQQPEDIKRTVPFYEEYMSHSKITRHAFLIGLWETPDEKARGLHAWELLFRERKKIDPYYHKGMHSP